MQVSCLLIMMNKIAQYKYVNLNKLAVLNNIKKRSCHYTVILQKYICNPVIRGVLLPQHVFHASTDFKQLKHKMSHLLKKANAIIAYRTNIILK